LTKPGSLRTDMSVGRTKRDLADSFRKWGISSRHYDIRTGLRDAEVIITRPGHPELRLQTNRFDDPETNLRALFFAIDATRLMAQRGILEEAAQVATAFLSAPAAAPVKRVWYEVLGVMPTADDEVIEGAYKQLARKRHPDAGGSEEAMTELNLAFEEYGAARDAR
jgi:DnaJ domain